MRVGLVLANHGATIAGVADELRRAEALGFDSAWIPGIPNGPDVVTLLAVAGASTRRIEVGSAVLPALPRHPAALAAQALVAGEALGGRFTLGLGVSHRKVVEGHLGLEYDRPVSLMRDYLAILRPLLREQRVDHAGPRLRTRLRLDVATAQRPPPVMLAALGPAMVHLAGTAADGVMTWMAGPETLATAIVAGAHAAAAAAGRPAPRVLASFPVALTGAGAGARDAARARADEDFSLYGRLPAYRAALAREGDGGPGQVALVGDERHLARAIARVRDAGVTDLQATPYGDPPTIERTIEYLAGRPAG